MESGIWVNAEKAKKSAEETIEAIKYNAWKEYIEGLRWYATMERRGIWFSLFAKSDLDWKEHWKPRKKRLSAEQARYLFNSNRLNSKSELAYFRDNGRQRKICNKVIRACKVPPADGKIFLTLDDVKSINL